MATSLDGVLIKKANKRETFTNEQVEQLLKCTDTDDGYDYFARNFAYIQHPVRASCCLIHLSIKTDYLKVIIIIDLILICYQDKQVKLPVRQYICYGMLCLFLIKLF